MFVISCGFARTPGWPPHDQTLVIKWNLPYIRARIQAIDQNDQ
jgi:hypothetical protein